MSRGLEALKRIKDFLVLNTKHWKQDVGYIEEELKALAIIKDTLGIRLSETQNTLGETYYYIEIGGVVSYLLKRKEEYDLLKEVLS